MARGREVSEQLTAIEGTITQLEGEGGQDALNYPGRLDNQWAALYSAVANPDTVVTAGSWKRYEDLLPEYESVMSQLRDLYDGALAELNTAVSAVETDAIRIPELPGGDESAQ